MNETLEQLLEKFTRKVFFNEPVTAMIIMLLERGVDVRFENNTAIPDVVNVVFLEQRSGVKISKGVSLDYAREEKANNG